MKRYMNYKLVGILACALVLAFGIGYYVNSAPSATTVGDNIEAKGTVCDGSGNCLGDIPEWVDITSDTGLFDIDCEYRWYNPDFSVAGGTSGTWFYSTAVSAVYIGTDWAGGSFQYVLASNKSDSLGQDTSTDITTEMRCN